MAASIHGEAPVGFFKQETNNSLGEFLETNYAAEEKLIFT